MIKGDEANNDETIIEEVIISADEEEESKDILPNLKSQTTEQPAKKKKKRRYKIKAKKMILNVSLTKYHVVRYVARTIFNMRLSNYSQTNTDCFEDKHEWDLLWTDGIVKVDTLYKMKGYQRINHFPGMYALARKDHLARNLARLAKYFPNDYDFFPQTWLLPAEFGEFRKQFENVLQNGRKKHIGRKTYISKPEASCQGKGIFLTRTLEDFEKTEHYVVQRYLHKPYLIDGFKFDLRIYILLCGVDPLRIYFFKEGLCRLATDEYMPP